MVSSRYYAGADASPLCLCCVWTMVTFEPKYLGAYTLTMLNIWPSLTLRFTGSRSAFLNSSLPICSLNSKCVLLKKHWKITPSRKHWTYFELQPYKTQSNQVNMFTPKIKLWHYCIFIVLLYDFLPASNTFLMLMNQVWSPVVDLCYVCPKQAAVVQQGSLCSSCCLGKCEHVSVSFTVPYNSWHSGCSHSLYTIS